MTIRGSRQVLSHGGFEQTTLIDNNAIRALFDNGLQWRRGSTHVKPAYVSMRVP